MAPKGAILLFNPTSHKDMKNKDAITLVRNGTVLYPLAESDYEDLRQSGCPITNLTNDYLPLLGSLLRSHQKKIQIVSFDPIEAEMLRTKILPKWPHPITATQAAVTLTIPKGEDEERAEKLQQALKRWYRNHYISFEISIKRTAKKITVTMRKVYGQPT